MNTLKKDLMSTLFRMHLDNKAMYLESLYDEAIELYDYTTTDTELIDYIKMKDYHDILIITHNTKKEYNKAINQLVLSLHQKIQKHEDKDREALFALKPKAFVPTKF